MMDVYDVFEHTQVRARHTASGGNRLQQPAGAIASSSRGRGGDCGGLILGNWSYKCVNFCHVAHQARGGSGGSVAAGSGNHKG